ncbi:enoyl-CoA hydratase/isomerase family protein [Olivibacter sitiensis]|uniref:enoyl-CoA hydratase/isomerase family protein n=1 Tax=Olivibacter sitiensis TaxID=376470 RepID=UPI0004138A18|nr:enoyl-CoA hydratase-related protein [Olivibacter sitiensis]
MSYINLITEIEGNIATIAINREKALNALNKVTLDELYSAFSEVFNDDRVRGIVLTGQGEKAFVAGADIKEFLGRTKEEGMDMARAGHRLFDFIQNAPKPVVAAINGFALGGGLELALACHIRIASTTAKMGLPEVSLGIIPGYGGTQRLSQLVGKGFAFEMILTGNMVEAERALQIGLVNHVVSGEELLTKAKEMLDVVASRSPKAISAAIRAINAVFGQKGFEVEIQEFGSCFGNSEFQEGVSAFLEKRKPKF